MLSKPPERRAKALGLFLLLNVSALAWLCSRGLPPSGIIRILFEGPIIDPLSRVEPSSHFLVVVSKAYKYNGVIGTMKKEGERSIKAYMSLSCKVAHYGDVFEGLLKMDIPSGDIFLLFGPVDILCKFEFDTLEEFKKDWFNRVRMMGGEEGWITRTMTFIVIESGGETVEEPFAVIFLNTQPRNLEKVQESLLKSSEVLTADTVFGPYDVICSIRANDQQHLERIISNIQRTVPGIEGSMTAIIAGMRV